MSDAALGPGDIAVNGTGRSLPSWRSETSVDAAVQQISRECDNRNILTYCACGAYDGHGIVSALYTLTHFVLTSTLEGGTGAPVIVPILQMRALKHRVFG